MRKHLRAWVLGLSLFTLGGLPLVAFAQDDEAGQEAEDPAASRAQTFEAAGEGAQTENIPGGMLMVAAYGVIWVLVMGYVMSLGMRQASTARELDRLQGDLAKYGRADGEG